MDVAAGEFYVNENNTYDLDFKNPNNEGEMEISGDELLTMYKGFVDNFPMVSVEDPFD